MYVSACGVVFYVESVAQGLFTMKIRKSATAVAFLAIFAVIIAQPAHAQSVTSRTDQAAYSPGGTGTLYVTIVNTSPTQTMEIRNLTIYFPWASFGTDGKWDSASNNVSVNLSPYKVLTTSGSPGGGNIYTYNTPFTVPSWWGSNTGGCNVGSTNTR